MESRVYALLAAFWICCAGTHLLYAQSGLNSFDLSTHPASRHYTMNDGLPDNGVNWVMQDTRGFIWLATYSGLSRYDGYKFLTYKQKPGYEKSLLHFYRKISDQTPIQFFRSTRLKRAADLLAKNSDNVTQIAYSVGFSSLSYFNKCFKRQFGIPPGKYSGMEKSKNHK